MDILEFLAVMIPVIIAGFLVMRWISMQDAANRYKAQKEARISAQNRIAAQQRGKGKNRDIIQDTMVLGAWVDQLANTFGFDPSVLFDDEMPEEVARLLPLAKGFVDSGGLGKLLSGAGAAQQPPTEKEPEMTGGPGW